MKLSLSSANFSLNGLELVNTYAEGRFSVIINKADYETFKSVGKTFGVKIVNFDLASSPQTYIIKIEVEAPTKWTVTITM